MSDTAAVQQGINAAASAAGDSDDEWEDLEDIGFPGSKKGRTSLSQSNTYYSFNNTTSVFLDLMAFGEEGSGRQSRIRDDETNVSFYPAFLYFFIDSILTQSCCNEGLLGSIFQGYLQRQYRWLQRNGVSPDR